ncbi:MAG TPA: AAA family ATPase [Candidatus Obscuribacterales bacterium]
MSGRFPSRNTSGSGSTGDHKPVEAFKREMPCGAAVLGTEPGCGKTVFMTGLAATLKVEGFPARAIKPFIVGSRREADCELSFISSITRTPLNYPILVIDAPAAVQESNWQHAVMMAASKQHLTLVELPGSCATPVSFEQGPLNAAPNWKDSADFACDLGLPCILVSRHNREALEKIVLNATYLQRRDARLIGIVTVETAEYPKQQALQLSQSDFQLAVVGRTNIPYLGCLKFSPSISVPRVNQGNLIKTTSAGIDLLMILRSINAPLSMSDKM